MNSNFFNNNFWNTQEALEALEEMDPIEVENHQRKLGDLCHWHREGYLGDQKPTETGWERYLQQHFGAGDAGAGVLVGGSALGVCFLNSDNVLRLAEAGMSREEWESCVNDQLYRNSGQFLRDYVFQPE